MIDHKAANRKGEQYCTMPSSSGPVLCRNEMEEWSASEANLFEEALGESGQGTFGNVLLWSFFHDAIKLYRRLFIFSIDPLLGSLHAVCVESSAPEHASVVI